MKLIHLFFCLLITTAGFTQARNLPLSLQLALEDADPDALVHLYLKGDHEAIASTVQSLGGTYKGSFRAYARVVLPAAQVPALGESPAVEYIHFDDYRGEALLDASKVHTRTNMVHDHDAGFYSAFDGTGVIIGMIDAGLDLEHPDFLLPNGNTRVIELWDQNLGFDAQRTPSYGYGQVWDSAEINAGLCPHDDQASFYGHGTNTTGIAAAYNWQDTLDQQFNGHAPGAELIVVSSDFNSFNWTATVADAVDYIFERAEQLGKPCVINASLGTYLGSHDARDVSAQMIDAKITEKEGRIMVCAAGNSGEEDPYHLGYTATSDTNFTWFDVGSSSSIYFEVFGDTGDFEQLFFSIGADRVTPAHEFRGNVPFDHILNRMNQLVEDTLYSTSGNYLAKVQTWADSTNGTYRLQYFISNIDSNNYHIRLMCTGGGRLDLWSAQWLGYNNMVFDNLPSTNEFPEIAYYKQPDELQSIVSSWACSDKVVTVGNFTNKKEYNDVDGMTVVFSSLTEGAIAASSSAGPARTGLLKPEVAAPGDVTLTAGAAFQIASQLSIPNQRNRVAGDTLHHRAGGTSSASPVVAGIAAMFLEKCNGLDWQDFQNALAQGAQVDQNTGSVPNFRWGNGKADAINTLRYSDLNPEVSATQTDFCQGETAELTLQGSYESILWTTGETGSAITTAESGLYYAEVTDDRGCYGISDTIAVFSRAIPVKPLLAMEGEMPACPGKAITISVEEDYGSYEWSNGLFTNEVTVTEPGDYFCRVTNIHGCENYSDTVSISYHPTTPTPEIALDVSGTILEVTAGDQEVEDWQWYYFDEPIADANDSILPVSDFGRYTVAYTDSNGCFRISDPLDVYSLGLASLPSGLRVFPNPFTDEIRVDSEDALKAYRLTDVSGRVIASKTLSSVSQLNIPTSTLDVGVYVLEVTTTQGSYLIKMTK